MSRSDPIFQSIFGEQWQHLPPVMHQHYANRPYSRDEVRIDGTMTVELSKWAQHFAFMFKWAGIVPYSGKDIPVSVIFNSEPHSTGFWFNRLFDYPDRPSYRMRSRMVPIGGDQVIETMRSGIGWRARYHYVEGQVRLSHIGYCITVFGMTCALPLAWLLGICHAYEEAIDHEHFRMFAALRHPILGQIYAYGGTFKITRVSRHDA